MSLSPSELLVRNQAWSTRQQAEDPEYFSRLVAQQNPEFFWIGCSDSRVPANEIIDLAPGEVFVHRNVANVVVHTDLNCLSVLQYAVEVLKVKHILVVGHYGCGGVNAALLNQRVGLADNWLRHVQDVRDKYRHWLGGIDDLAERRDRLCELNVIEQVFNVCETTVLHDAWARGQEVSVHGWVYRLADGIVNDLGASLSGDAGLIDAYDAAIQQIIR
jgi:carbonic anhydrase